jgi:hypothetical protein
MLSELALFFPLEFESFAIAYHCAAGSGRPALAAADVSTEKLQQLRVERALMFLGVMTLGADVEVSIGTPAARSTRSIFSLCAIGARSSCPPAARNTGALI